MEDRFERREIFGVFLVFAVSLQLLAGFLIGCANPGPPRPPSLHLPAMVRDLSAARIGDRVQLRWMTPSKTSDDLDIKGPLVAKICRSVGMPISSAKKSIAACGDVQSVPTGPGASSAWDDLPQPLLSGPVELLTYRIEILNPAGRSAGKSTPAFAAAGLAPAPVESLTATASEAGAVLRWKQPAFSEGLSVDLLRTDLTEVVTPNRSAVSRAKEPSHLGKQALPAKHHPPDHDPNRSPEQSSDEPNTVHLRAMAAAKTGSSVEGTVDTTASMGQTYRYVAQQIRTATINGQTLELRSEPAPAVTLMMRDTFPPKTPVGLATIPGATPASAGPPGVSYVDLSWEPDTEPDLAGYLVYRQLAHQNGDPQGSVTRLTPSPIGAPAYRDVAVTPGQRYIYSVSAVDASGNESAPSAKEIAAAQNLDSPQ